MPSESRPSLRAIEIWAPSVIGREIINIDREGHCERILHEKIDFIFRVYYLQIAGIVKCGGSYLLSGVHDHLTPHVKQLELHETLCPNNVPVKDRQGIIGLCNSVKI